MTLGELINLYKAEQEGKQIVCEKAIFDDSNRDFVIHNMLYHENTDMYFYYKQRNGLAILQPYEGTKLCDKCSDKQTLIFVGICLAIALLIISILFYFDRN